MSRFRQRKAFTIVEMVIVIAVIAILATVLVPTISGVIQKANHSTDVQFAASLNVQLAMYAVDKPINNESDLRDAINEFYGEWEYDDAGNKTKLIKDFYSELAPKSAKQGYHYWYDYKNGIVFVETVEDADEKLAEIGGGSISAENLFGSNKLSVNMKPGLLFFGSKNAPEGNIMPLAGEDKEFSPASLRTDLVKGAYLMGQSDDEETLTGIITKLENLTGAQDYENALKNLGDLAAVEEGEEPDGLQNAAVELLSKLAATTIITDFGAFRHDDLSGIDTIYVPMTVKVINITQNVYVYNTSGEFEGIVNDGVDTEIATSVEKFEIPAGVKVAANGLHFGHDIAPNETEFDDVTKIHVNTTNVDDLKTIFDMMATDCVIVTSDNREFVIIGTEVYELPLPQEKDENGLPATEPAVSGLGNSGLGEIKLELDCPEGNTVPGQDTIYFDKTTSILFVSYDRTESFTINVTGAHASLLEWFVTDEKPRVDKDGNEIKDSEGNTVLETVSSEWITLNGNKATLNHELAAGEDPYVTITVKVKGTNEEKRIRVYMVRPNDVTFDLDVHEDITGTLDNSKENEAGFDLTFDGENYMFEIKNAKVQYNPAGKVKAETVSFSVKSSAYFEVVTESGKTYLKMKENLASYNFSETLIATYGKFKVEFKLNMIDNSASAFENNWIVKDKVQMGKDYLFRVGNENAFKLGVLFDNTKTANNIVLEIYDKTAGAGGKFMIGSNSTFKATVANATDAKAIKDENDNVIGWQISSSNWKNVTIDFDGKGVAEIRIGNVVNGNYDGYATLLVEVVDGKNITDYSQLKTSGNNVLLGDITMTNDPEKDGDGVYKLSNGTLFGNGFTFDVKQGETSGSGTVTGNYVVYLVSANLDNVKVVGRVNTGYGVTTKESYNRPTVLIEGNSGIYNSYVSNGMSAVRVRNGNVVIENSTLKGGKFANLELRGGETTLKNVTTINQVDANDKAEDGSTVVGLGIAVWYDGTPDETKLLIEGTLTQHNYLSKKQAETYINDSLGSRLVSAMYASSLSAYQYNDGTTVWMNTGIVSMSDKFNKNDVLVGGVVTNPSGYSSQDVDMYIPELLKTVSGYAWTATKATVQSNYTAVLSEWVPTAQNVIVPTYSFDYTTKNYDSKADEKDNDYCIFDSTKGMVMIGMDQGDKFNWDTSILTAKKNDQTLSYTVSMNGADYTGKSITFDTEGTYTVVYTYTDSNNYKKDGSSFSVTYTKKVTINVVVKAADAKNAEFDFGGNGYKTVKIGDKIYVMPNVTATSSTVGSKTVSGTTVYFPIVQGYTSNGKTSQTSGTKWYMYFPVFKDTNGTKATFLTITDYADEGLGDAVVYDGSTTTLPAGLSVSNPATTFQYSSSATAPTTPTKANNVLVYTSPEMEGVSRDATTVDATYSYTDNSGNTYYYIVRYSLPKISNTACVTGDTLVTLADGTQKEIQYVNYNDELLVWNHFIGRYETVSAAIIFNHGYDYNTVIKLNFSDGTQVKAINLHQFLDVDLKQYVTISADTVAQYVGHSFAKQDGDTYTTVTLESYEISEEYIEAYGIISALHYNILVEGMFSTDFMLEDYDLFNYFTIGDGLVYDAEQMQKDIEQYGLYTYEDFADYLTYEQFVGFNVQYFKIAVGRGLYTYEGILDLINEYLNA